MIPMAVSLAFGVVVSTVFTLILVPCEIAILEDLSRRGAVDDSAADLVPDA